MKKLNKHISNILFNTVRLGKAKTKELAEAIKIIVLIMARDIEIKESERLEFIDKWIKSNKEEK